MARSVAERREGHRKVEVPNRQIMVNVHYRKFFEKNVWERDLISFLWHPAAHVSVLCSFRTGPTFCWSLQLKPCLEQLTEAVAACHRNRMRVCATTGLACFETPRPPSQDDARPLALENIHLQMFRTNASFFLAVDRSVSWVFLSVARVAHLCAARRGVAFVTRSLSCDPR
jgi:hypothetical protein